MPLLGADLSLFNLVAEVPSDVDQGGARHARQQRARQRRGNDFRIGTGAEHEGEVHSAHLFDVLVLDGVQPYDLVAALGLSLFLRQQGCGVVSGKLCRARTARARAHVVGGKPYAHWLDAAGEVRSCRRSDDAVGVAIRRVNAEGNLTRNHKWTQVQSFLATSGWNPLLVHFHDLAQRFKEQFLRQLRHRQATGRVLEPLGIAVGAESFDGSVGLAVGLNALENCLAIVENRGGWIHLERSVRLHAGIVPTISLVPVNEDHMVGEVATKPRITQDFLNTLRGCRILRPRDGECFRCRRLSTHGADRTPWDRARG